MLDNADHALDIIGRVTPIALRIEIAEFQHLLRAEMNLRHGIGDFPRHEFPARSGDSWLNRMPHAPNRSYASR